MEWTGGRNGYAPASSDEQVEVLQAAPGHVVLRVDGISTRFDGVVTDDHVHVDSALGSVSLRVVPRFVDPADQVAEGSLLAPMPGSVISVSAAVGDEVTEGQTILVMEAMKMQHTVVAPYAGTITELAVRAGQQVASADVLAVVEPAEGEQHEQRNPRVHRARGAHRAARGGQEAGHQLRPLLRAGEDQQGREAHRAVVRHGQARLPRGQHSRAVRRRWWRHGRPLRGARGGCGRGRSAADDGGQPGRSAARSSPAAAPRSRSSAGSPRSPTAR